MSTRLDSVLQKHPDHEEGIRLLAERDPSGNLKYLAWGAKMLAAGQALAPEVADVLDLFHRFAGQWLPRSGAQARRRAGLHRVTSGNRVHPDINTYRPQDFAKFRELLFKCKRAQDKKRREREKLYRIEGSVEVDVVYDSDDLIVRHIKNKNASIHYGHATKWCISMTQEGYFEDYETHNATFFFFERKKPEGNEFDKVCLMVPRNYGESHHRFRDEDASAFNALDQRVDVFALAAVHGSRVFEIFRLVYEASERYPGSVLFQVFGGAATREQLDVVFASLVKGDFGYETDDLLEAIVCNDAAPAAMLEEILKRGVALSAAGRKKVVRRHGRRFRNRWDHDAELTRKIMAALVIHSETPGELRVELVKNLRRRHVKIQEIRRTKDDGRVGVEYRIRRRRRFRRRHWLDAPVGVLRSRVRGLERRIVQTKKAIEKRIAADRKKKLAREKKRAAKQKKKR
jgi:hypothetical protein